MKHLSWILLILLLSLTKNGICIECYDCQSPKDYYCGLFFRDLGDESRKTNCPSGVPCMKVKLPAYMDGDEPVLRGCNDESKCTEHSVCYTCEEDLCNSSSNLSSAFVFLSIINIARLYLL